MALNNEGAWPIDPSTATGLFRFEVGDTVGTPDAPGDIVASFEFMGDNAIDALIAAYPDSIDTAKAKALGSMATQLITSAQDIQVDEIKIKTVERANLMMKFAGGLLSNAGFVDASEAFDVVPLNSANNFFPRVSRGRPGSYGPSGY